MRRVERHRRGRVGSGQTTTVATGPLRGSRQTRRHPMSGPSSRLGRLPDASAAAYRRNHLARNSSWLILSTGANGVLGCLLGHGHAQLPDLRYWRSKRCDRRHDMGASTVAMMGLGMATLEVLPRADDETWSAAVNALVIGGAVVGVGVGAVTAAILPHISAKSFTAIWHCRHYCPWSRGVDCRRAARLCLHR